jgi:drug/metabolite transporter (DMT)-like permease
LVYLFSKKVNISKINTKDIFLLFAAVMAGSIVANYVYYGILEKNQTYLVTILTSVSPILTILIAYAFLKEDITPKQWIGIIVAIIGITLTVS